MKLLVVLLLVAASVQSIRPHRRVKWPWAPGVETKYRFQSKVLNRLSDINPSQAAGIKMTSDVIIQSEDGFSLAVKFLHPRFNLINGKAEQPREHSRVPSAPETLEPIPQEFMHYLEQPFLVNITSSGLVRSFVVEQGEPVAVTNIKRSVISQLQLNVLYAKNLKIVAKEHILSMLDRPVPSEKHGYHYPSFHHQESSLHGKCKTSYTINRIPQATVNELEQKWQARGRLGSHDSGKGVEICKGKPYYMITKTRDLDECEERPVYQRWVGIDGDCDFSRASCRGVFTHMASSSYFICGLPSEYFIRKIDASDKIVASPLGYNTKEVLKTSTKIELELLEKKPLHRPLPLPVRGIKHRSLTYAFGEEQQDWTANEIAVQTKAMIGMFPVLPQPDLTEPPKPMVPWSLKRQDIIEKAEKEMHKIAHFVLKSPQSCSSKEDVAGSMTTVAKYLRMLGYSDLKELKDKLAPRRDRILKEIFEDVLAMVGTNPSTMLLKKLIETDEITKSKVVPIIQTMMRSVRTPTKKLMRELISMLEHHSIRSQPKVMSALMIHISNLFYNAYVNPSHRITKYPIRIYGVFGTLSSTVITDEYIPMLANLTKSHLKGTEDEELIGISAVMSLGKLGHYYALPTLAKVIEGHYSKSPSKRSIAVYALKRIAKMEPSNVKPLLMSMATNKNDNEEVRIAAISILPYAGPTEAELQRLAVQTWYEPSKQVASFIHSTFKNLVHTDIPELKPVGKAVAPLLKFLRIANYGMQYSHNLHLYKLVEYLQSVFNQKIHVTNGKHSLIPAKIELDSQLFASSGSWKAKLFTLSTYTVGIDKIIDKYLHYFGHTDEAAPSVKDQLNHILNELQVEGLPEKDRKLIYLSRFIGYENLNIVSYHDLLHMAENALKIVGKSRDIEFNYVRGLQIIDLDVVLPSESGFPIYLEHTVPLVYGARGSFKVKESETNTLLPTLSAKILPVLNIKYLVSYGVMFPPTEKFIGSGAEMALHTSLPIEGSLKLEQNKLKVNLKLPTESEVGNAEVLHGYVLPFTVVDKYINMKPVTKSPHLIPFLSGNPIKKTETEPFYKSIGISAKLVTKSDAERTDFSSYYEKIIQHNTPSLIFLAPLMSSIRNSSFRLEVSPSRSETKEIELDIFLGSLLSEMRPKIEKLKEIIEVNGMPTLLPVINELEEEGKSKWIGVHSSLKGRNSVSKQAHLGIQWGSKKVSELESKNFLVMGYKPIEGQVYSFLLASKVKLPKVKARWNKEKILDQDLEMLFEGLLEFGIKKQDMHKIILNSKFTKTEELKRSVRQSPEFRKCTQLEEKEQKLSPICMKARHLAASLDKVEMVIKSPELASHSRPFLMLKSYLSSVFFLLTSLETTGPSSPTLPNELKVIGKINVTGAAAELFVKYDKEYKIKHVRVPEVIRKLFPISPRNPLSNWFLQRITMSQTPASCRIEPKIVTTFDNLTYHYPINDCYHVLLVDRKKTMPVAVLSRTVEKELKAVKILSGKYEVKLVPKGSAAAMEVKINEEIVKVARGQIIVKKAPKTDLVELLIERYEDDVFYVYSPQQSLQVLTNGRHVEVVAPQLLRARTAGLCGDLNGEPSFDVKSPKNCVMRPPIAAVSYILNKSGSSHESAGPVCSGIPSEKRSEFEKESNECAKDVTIRSRTSELLRTLQFVDRPLVGIHVIETMPSKICISKQMIKLCTAKLSSTFSEVKVKHLEFVCVKTPSVKGQSLEIRARKGENLFIELYQMPVIYMKTIHEPASCEYVDMDRIGHQSRHNPVYRGRSSLFRPFRPEE